LTRELVEAGYSETRILKLYGGNWLRLLSAVWGDA
ncbi:membrane dipeptidase, partial [Mycobacterium tuberculosis]|nr:membrane dipeptidase [Mycobacterium tuberculosis]